MNKGNNMQTPYFILHKQSLDSTLQQMKAALSATFTQWKIGYSFKTNSLLWVVDYMKHQDCYAEVVSHQEYALAKHVGYTNIIYNGPMKDKATFLQALQEGHIVNLETHREVQWLAECSCKAKIGMRVNFDIEQACPGQSACGAEGGRFGFCYENGTFLQVLQSLQAMPHVEVVGLHMHVSSKTRSTDIYKALAQKAAAIAEEYHLQLEYVDIGGGFFGGMPNKPSFLEYFTLIKENLGALANTTFIVEPGASLIASPFDYVCSVIDVKDTPYNRFVVLDGTRGDVDPHFNKTAYLYSLHSKGEAKHVKQILAGYTCMENDRLCTLQNESALQVGDQVHFHKVGSYTMCLAPNFIKYSPAVYLQDGESTCCIKKQWGVEEYIQGAERYE